MVDFKLQQMWALAAVLRAVHWSFRYCEASCKHLSRAVCARLMPKPLGVQHHLKEERTAQRLNQLVDGPPHQILSDDLVL